MAVIAVDGSRIILAMLALPSASSQMQTFIGSGRHQVGQNPFDLPFAQRRWL
jgi:hypothetical protein